MMLKLSDEVSRSVRIYYDESATRINEIALYSEEYTSQSIKSHNHHSVDNVYPLVHATREDSVGPISLYIIKEALITGKLNILLDGDVFWRPDLMPTYWKTQALEGIAGDMSIGPEKLLIEGPPSLISVSSTGYEAYGHWWLDILPRIWIMRKNFPSLLDSTPTIFPSNLPDFALEMLKIFDFPTKNIFFYDPSNSVVKTRLLYTPSLAHRDYTFHSIFKSFIDDTLRALALDRLPCSGRKIYVSRSRYLAKSAGERRHIANEQKIMELALSRGYELVFPEELSLIKKIEIFRRASVIVGEYGSGLHHSMFSHANICLVCFGIMNNVQGSLATMFDQNVMYLKPSETFQEGARVMTVNLTHLSESMDWAESFTSN